MIPKDKYLELMKEINDIYISQRDIQCENLVLKIEGLIRDFFRRNNLVERAGLPPIYE